MLPAMTPLAPHAAWGGVAPPLSSRTARRAGSRGVRASRVGAAVPQRALAARRVAAPPGGRFAPARCALSQPGPYQGDTATDEVRAGRGPTGVRVCVDDAFRGCGAAFPSAPRAEAPGAR